MIIPFFGRTGIDLVIGIGELGKEEELHLRRLEHVCVYRLATCLPSRDREQYRVRNRVQRAWVPPPSLRIATE